MSWKRVIVVGIVGLVALIALGVSDRGPLSGNGGARAAEFATSPLAVITTHGRFAFTVEMAVTPEQRSQGLQFRHSLAADAGMLFDFGRNEEVTMWMADTPIPLDMVFIDQAGRVTRVIANTTPYSLKLIPSGGPVRAVLELAAGTAARLAIREGSRIQHPLFDGQMRRPPM